MRKSASVPSKVLEEVDFLYQKKSDFWKKEREHTLVNLFHSCAQNIPAYADFLEKAGIDKKALAKVQTCEDFQKTVPPVGKDNYLRKYPWENLCVPHALASQSLVLTSTSGSTGQPFYFPRNTSLDMHSSAYHEMFLRGSGIMEGIGAGKSTLVLVCFGMGIWVGGIITYQAFKSIAERGHPLTILTPGVNKKEIFEALKNVGPKYDQIILCAYPPFMKDVVDEAKDNGIDWKDLNVKMVFAAEAFSEKFRDYIMKKTGMKNPYRDTANIYGSADLGTMAMETPISILIRRLALGNIDLKNPLAAKKIYKGLFGDASRLPTLAQYIPHFINFDCADKNVYVSGDNVMPLVRYAIGDNGGVHDFADIERIFAAEGINLREEARKMGIEDTITELPFVYIYERTDLSTKLYGAIVYPEYIKHGLHHDDLEKYLTGKFTMFTKHDDKQDEYLEINIELKPGTTESDWLKKEAAERIHEALTEKSAEYTYLTGMLKDRVRPQTVFWPHEHPMHFQPGGKQKWVKKAPIKK